MKNISIQNYISSEVDKVAELEMILELLKPKNDFRGKKMNINAMPYVNVKYCIKLLTLADNWDKVAELFHHCFDVDRDKFYRASVVEFFQAKKYLIDEFTRIVKTEAKILSSESVDQHLWMMAGGDRLKPFSDTLPTVQLGKHFGEWPQDVGRKPYGEVFMNMAQLKIQSDVEREYQNIKSN